MGTEEYTPRDLQRCNPTAEDNYKHQGPGVGAGFGALTWTEEVFPWFKVKKNTNVIEIGFGAGEFLLACAQRGARAEGIDIAQACIDHVANVLLQDVRVSNQGKTLTAYPGNGGVLKASIMDISRCKIKSEDNYFNFASCTETIEHLSDPFHMVAEVKRVLRHGGLFTIAYPQPDRNLGFGGGQHAHIYPGFLKRDSFELFMKQLYFKQLACMENGSSDWSIWANYKGPGVVDVFAMGSGNYDEKELFAPLDNWNFMEDVLKSALTTD